MVILKASANDLKAKQSFFISTNHKKLGLENGVSSELFVLAGYVLIKVSVKP